MQGLSEFLVDHIPCAGGLEISHPDGLGNGPIRMSCPGCGRWFDYAPDGFPPAPEARSSPGRSSLLVAGLVLIAVVAIAVGAILVTEGRAPSSGTANTPPKQVVETGGVRLSAPAGWKQARRNGNFVLSSPAGGARIAVVESKPAGDAAELLRSRPPGGRVSPPIELEVGGGMTGFRVLDTGAGGSEMAIGAIDGPSRYMVVATTVAGASDAERAGAVEALETAHFLPNRAP